MPGVPRTWLSSIVLPDMITVRGEPMPPPLA